MKLLFNWAIAFRTKNLRAKCSADFVQKCNPLTQLFHCTGLTLFKQVFINNKGQKECELKGLKSDLL